jgi:hypothetical protein
MRLYRRKRVVNVALSAGNINPRARNRCGSARGARADAAAIARSSCKRLRDDYSCAGSAPTGAFVGKTSW